LVTINLGQNVLWKRVLSIDEVVDEDILGLPWVVHESSSIIWRWSTSQSDVIVAQVNCESDFLLGDIQHLRRLKWIRCPSIKFKLIDDLLTSLNIVIAGNEIVEVELERIIGDFKVEVVQNPRRHEFLHVRFSNEVLKIVHELEWLFLLDVLVSLSLHWENSSQILLERSQLCVVGEAVKIKVHSLVSNNGAKLEEAKILA
jgi:hypothetical protein